MQTVIEYGLANAVAATILAVVVFIVGWFVRSPALRHGLWLLVFARLVLPPVWQVPLSWPRAEPVEVASSEEEFDISRAMFEPEEIDWTPLPEEEVVADGDAFRVSQPLEEVVSEVIPESFDAIEVAEEPVVATAPPSVGQPSLASYLPTLGLALWGTGTLWILWRAVVRVRRFQRILKHGSPASAEMQAEAASWAERMGLREEPQIWLVPGRVWPSLWLANPWDKSRVILPQGLLALLSEEQKQAVLIHELAHLRRRDHLVRWLELAVGALYWWHPLLSWFKQQLRESEEAACDLWVVTLLQNRKAYATALVEMVDYLNDSETATVPTPACGAGPVRHLQRRLTMIMRSKWSARLSRWGMALVLGIGTIAFSFGPTWTSEAIGQDGPKDRKQRDGDREKGDRPRDGDRRPEGPRDGFRPKDGFRGPKEGFGRGPRDGDRPSRESDLEAARSELRKAREEVQKANERMHAATERLSRLEGRPGPGREREGDNRQLGPQPREAGRFGPPMRERAGDDRPDGPPRGDARPTPPFRPGFGPGGPGGPFARGPRPAEAGRPAAPATPARPAAPEASGEIKEMKKQIDELRQLLTEMRRELRRDDRKK